MAAEEIASILINAKKNHLPICSICLRNERNLKFSDSFVSIAKKLMLRVPENKLLCYICESQVTRALQTLNAVTFACRRGDDRRLAPLKALKDDLHRATKNLRFGEQSRTLDEYWEFIRARTLLTRTESLVVSSDQVSAPQAYEGCTEGWKTNEEQARQPSPAPVVSLPQPRPDPTPIVVIEDDDPPPPKPKLLVSIEKLLEDKTSNSYALTADSQQIMVKDVNDPQTLIVYPIVVGIDMVKYVPLLNAKIVDDVVETVSENELTKNIYQDLNYNVRQDYIMPIRGSMMNVKVMEKMPPKLTIGDEGGKDPPLSSNGPVKQAIMNDKVDWEDKIPMDVISFVDATDPNAEQYFIPKPISTTSEQDPLRPHRTAPADPLVQQRSVATSPYRSESDITVDKEIKKISARFRQNADNLRKYSDNLSKKSKKISNELQTRSVTLLVDSDTLRKDSDTFRKDSDNRKSSDELKTSSVTLRMNSDTFRTSPNTQKNSEGRTLRDRASIKPPQRYKKPRTADAETEVVIDLC